MTEPETPAESPADHSHAEDGPSAEPVSPPAEVEPPTPGPDLPVPPRDVPVVGGWPGSVPSTPTPPASTWPVPAAPSEPLPTPAEPPAAVPSAPAEPSPPPATEAIELPSPEPTPTQPVALTAATPSADAAPETSVEPPLSGTEPVAAEADVSTADHDAPSGVRGVLVPVLAALAVVLLGLTGFLGWKAVDTAGAPSVETSRTQALTSARDAARAVFSYDYRHLTKDFAAGKAVTTGTFADQYSGTTAKLLDFALKNKATVAADVSDASVVRASEDEVVCLVFLNQTSSSSAVGTPRITQSRLEMTMRRRGGDWLVASINAL